MPSRRTGNGIHLSSSSSLETTIISSICRAFAYSFLEVSVHVLRRSRPGARSFVHRIRFYLDAVSSSVGSCRGPRNEKKKNPKIIIFFPFFSFFFPLSLPPFPLSPPARSSFVSFEGGNKIKKKLKVSTTTSGTGTKNAENLYPLPFPNFLFPYYFVSRNLRTVRGKNDSVGKVRWN